jgi:hypothetical protein
MPMAVCMIVARRVIVPVGMFGLIPVCAPRRMIMRVLVVWVVMPVMIVLFHSAHLTSLAQGSA